MGNYGTNFVQYSLPGDSGHMTCDGTNIYVRGPYIQYFGDPSSTIYKFDPLNPGTPGSEIYSEIWASWGGETNYKPYTVGAFKNALLAACVWHDQAAEPVGDKLRIYRYSGGSWSMVYQANGVYNDGAIHFGCAGPNEMVLVRPCNTDGATETTLCYYSADGITWQTGTVSGAFVSTESGFWNAPNSDWAAVYSPKNLLLTGPAEPYEYGYWSTGSKSFVPHAGLSGPIVSISNNGKYYRKNSSVSPPQMETASALAGPWSPVALYNTNGSDKNDVEYPVSSVWGGLQADYAQVDATYAAYPISPWLHVVKWNEAGGDWGAWEPIRNNNDDDAYINDIIQINNEAWVYVYLGSTIYQWFLRDTNWEVVEPPPTDPYSLTHSAGGMPGAILEAAAV